MKGMSLLLAPEHSELESKQSDFLLPARTDDPSAAIPLNSSTDFDENVETNDVETNRGGR